MDNQNLNQQKSFANELSYQEILFLVNKYKFTILISVFSFVILMVFYTIFSIPKYKSSAMIMIDPKSSSTFDIFDITSGQEKQYIENEMKILTSRTTAVKTIEALFDKDKWNNLYTLNTRKYNRNKTISYIANFFNDDSKEIFSFEKNPSDSVILLLSEKLRNNIKVTNSLNTDMLYISYTTNDPYEAAYVLNTLIEVYRTINLSWEVGDMTHLKTFLLEQIDKKELELNEIEGKLNVFQENEKIFAIDDNSKLLLDNLINVESEYYSIEAEKNIANERLRYIEVQLSEEEKNLSNNITNSINNRMYALKNEVALKESELISAISQQGEEHQLVKSLKEKLLKLKTELKTETRELISKGISTIDPILYRQSLMDSVISINSVIAMLNSKSEEYKKLIKKYSGDLENLPDKMLEFSRLTRNLNIQSETYSLMQQKLEEARINEASKVGNIRKIDKANINLKPISPSKRKNLLIGIILGLGMSFILILIKQILDNTVNSIEEISKKGLTLLSIIPSMGTMKSGRKQKKYQKALGNAEKIQRRLITHEDPKSPVSEAFRSLRTSLLYSASKKSKGANVILVSSPGPGEGKTTTIINLAITYANLGKKTIIIDGDLRKPVLHNVFSLEKEPGVTSYLTGNLDEKSKFIKNTEIDNLDLITCGIIPPNPSEILASSEMENLMSKLNDKYDIILIDAPPLLAVTDAFITMNYVNQFILVVRSGKTEKGGLDRALELLTHSNAPICGAVMNDVDQSNTYGGGYYYNYYQYYYGEKK